MYTFQSLLLCGPGLQLWDQWKPFKDQLLGMSSHLSLVVTNRKTYHPQIMAIIYNTYTHQLASKHWPIKFFPIFLDVFICNSFIIGSWIFLNVKSDYRKSSLSVALSLGPGIFRFTLWPSFKVWYSQTCTCHHSQIETTCWLILLLFPQRNLDIKHNPNSDHSFVVTREGHKKISIQETTQWGL